MHYRQNIMLYRVPLLFSSNIKLGETALMRAAYNSHQETVIKLIESGASMDTTNKVSMASM